MNIAAMSTNANVNTNISTTPVNSQSNESQGQVPPSAPPLEADTETADPTVPYPQSGSFPTWKFQEMSA